SRPQAGKALRADWATGRRDGRPAASRAACPGPRWETAPSTGAPWARRPDAGRRRRRRRARTWRPAPGTGRRGGERYRSFDHVPVGSLIAAPGLRLRLGVVDAVELAQQDGAGVGGGAQA